MADKMMRIAGRGSDGLSKAIRTDLDGRLLSAKYKKVFLQEANSADGREIEPSATWESGLFNVEDINTVAINTYMNTSGAYDLKITMYSLPTTSGLVTIGTTSFTHGSATFRNFPLIVGTDRIRITITNKSTSATKFGVYLRGLNNDNQINIHNQTTGLFEQQPLIGTEKTLEEIKNNQIKEREVYLSEAVSGDGRVVSANETWESGLFNVENVNRIAINTSVSAVQSYTLKVTMYTLPTFSGLLEVDSIEFTEGLRSFKDIPLPASVDRIRVSFTNNAENDIGVGFYLRGFKDETQLNYLDEQQGKMKHQTQIATEKTVKELLSLVEAQNRVGTNKEESKKVQPKPILKNVRLVEVESEEIRNALFFHDGYFYGSYYKKLLKSVDGENWEYITTPPFEHPYSGIVMLLVSDTGRIIAGNTMGEVLISDEQGDFTNATSLKTGQLNRMFGSFKHENYLGFTTYENPHGFDGDQKHEAWLSVDNGATFTNIFNNDTLIALIGDHPEKRVHLHNIEYDPYSGRIYIWQGDYDSRTFYYTDDFGETWNLGFPRGSVSNATTMIATPTGIAFGGDTEGGGFGYLYLDRSNNIKPEINIDNYVDQHWKLNQDGGRYIASNAWKDRENNVYLVGFDVEHDWDNKRPPYLAYSSNGEDWQVLWQGPHKGDGRGFQNVFYGNNRIVGTYRYSSRADDQTCMWVADVDLDKPNK